MGTMSRLAGLAGILLLGACVTINIYFPAAAAEKAADKVIQEVWGETPAAPAEPPPGPQGSAAPLGSKAAGWSPLDLVVPPAHAQGQANIDIDTPAIRQITASMQARHARLAPYYASGAVGLTANGELAVRDPGAVPLQDRRTVNQLVADDNRDRGALYREVAQANGHPEWEADIRNTFARRWVANAPAGWWYQGAGGAGSGSEPTGRGPRSPGPAEEPTCGGCAGSRPMGAAPLSGTPGRGPWLTCWCGPRTRWRPASTART